MQPSLASVLQDASWLGLCHSRRLSDSPADHALQTRAAIAEPPPSVTVAFRDRPVDICQRSILRENGLRWRAVRRDDRSR